MTTNSPVRVLIVDDEPYVCDVLNRWLSEEGYDSDTAADAEQASVALGLGTYELLLLDVSMPGISGVDLLAQVRKDHPDIVVIMVTAISDRETALRCMRLGAYAYILKPFDEREVLVNVVGALEEHRRAREARRQKQLLVEEIRDQTEEIRRREEEIALRLVAAAEYRDEDSSGHVKRVGMFSEVLARALGWGHEDVDDIRVAATMHDIGKIGVPDGISLKPAKLTPEEFLVVKEHTEIGARMLSDSDTPLIQMAEQIARSHHEKWNGSGYPQGLAEEAIPKAARIVAIADVFDSLTHARNYRPAFSVDEALAMMQEERGEHFDPMIFDVFLESLPAFRRITEQVSEESPGVAPA